MIHVPNRSFLPLAALFVLFLTIGCKTIGVAQNGFKQLFDGKTMNGWQGDTAYWRAENGMIVGEVTPSKPLKTNTF